MSLLVSVTLKHFTVTCSDGLAVRIENGVLVPSSRSSCKYWTVAKGDIAMGSTGSSFMGMMISTFATSLAEKHLDDPELFSILEKAIPDELQRVNKLFPTNIEYLDGTESINLGGTNLLMAGYDSSQQRIRSIFWGCLAKGATDLNLTPRDCADKIQAIGYGKAVALVLEKLDVADCFTPWDVERNVKSVIQQAAEAFPQFIGGTIYTHVISVPELKEIYEDLKNETAKLVAN